MRGENTEERREEGVKRGEKEGRENEK